MLCPANASGSRGGQKNHSGRRRDRRLRDRGPGRRRRRKQRCRGRALYGRRVASPAQRSRARPAARARARRLQHRQARRGRTLRPADAHGRAPGAAQAPSEGRRDRGAADAQGSGRDRCGASCDAAARARGDVTSHRHDPARRHSGWRSRAADASAPARTASTPAAVPLSTQGSGRSILIVGALALLIVALFAARVRPAASALRRPARRVPPGDVHTAAAWWLRCRPSSAR